MSPAFDEAGEKVSVINIIHHALSVVPVSRLVQSRGIFLTTILQMRVFSRNTFNKEGIPFCPIVKCKCFLRGEIIWSFVGFFGTVKKIVRY